MEAEPSDRILVEEYLSGNTEGLGRIYDRYHPQVFRFLLAFTDRAAADDILQETFMKAGEKLGSYRHEGRLLPWLLTIARRKALDHLRQRKRGRARRFAEQEEDGLEWEGSGPEEHSIRREIRTAIDEAVSSLPECQRTVFLMREETALSFKEIAESMGIPVNTALSHMHRALQSLRENLEHMEPARQLQTD